MAILRRLLLLRLSCPHPQLQPAADALSSPALATHSLSPTPALLTPSRPFAFSSSAERRRLRIEPSLRALRSGFTTDGNSSYGWYRRLGSTVGAVLVGQAAVFLGLSNDSALAQDDSVSLGTTRSKQAEGSTSGLQQIEDGSVISNEHTIKWRIFTDNARDFFLKGKIDEAEKFFQAALHEAKEGFGLRDPHAASALNNLAEFYRLRKEYDKAELLYLEAIEILEESFGSDDIRVGTALHSLGICYHLQHKFTQAQTCYERALKIEGRVMGVVHPEYASTMYLLAKVLSLQGKGKDAETLMQESIRILEESGLGESLACIQRMRYLSKELIKSNRFAEAENWQRKILHNLELSKGWDSLDTTNAAELLSFTLQTIGKLKESEELLERCLEVRKKILPGDHFQIAGTLVHLARLSMLKFISDLNKVNSDHASSDLVSAKQLVNDSIRITEGILNHSRKDLSKLSSASATDRDKIAATGVLDLDYHPIEQALHKCISLYKEPHTRSLASKAVKQDYLRCLRRLTSIVQDNFVVSQSIKLQELLGEAQQIMEELGESNSKT